ncbi:MAG: DNA-directed RNA polymerase subunit P [Thermoplasmata archaeon]|jgi:DNA-directed RNA polymerase subunit RPC12/RpoP|nr:MAG: DNA-directed RNA polymerase subunit P [Thermoplasmata archaeon]
MTSYKCGKCRRTVDIDPEKMGIKCPICGGKIFYKERGTVAKKIKAR